jgi:hypothetical protein
MLFVDKKHQSKSLDETLFVKIPNQISPHKKRKNKKIKKCTNLDNNPKLPYSVKNHSTWKLVKIQNIPEKFKIITRAKSLSSEKQPLVPARGAPPVP